VRKRADLSDFAVDAISNYVDQNPLFPNQIRDWNCGSRSYDQANGYNHRGIDIFTWPFTWKKMDDNEVEIVAAAAGTITLRSDGNFDRSCSLSGGNWNAVYVRHSDNSVAWYGHMKNGSVTSKPVGSTVAEGEKLGIVGSSGNSSGPHLHFELYNALGQLQDPFQGPCNVTNTESWWASQEQYRVSRINRLMTHSAAPDLAFNACPTAETTNERTTFRPGQTVYAGAYYRDQLAGQQTQYSLIRPDNTAYQSWSHTSPQLYGSSFWYWSYGLPANAPAGTWKFRALHNGTTYEQPFAVSDSAIVGGGVTTPDGRGLRAIVTITNPTGVTRSIQTSSFGFYSFDNVALGQQHTLRVLSRRYRFTAQVLNVNDNLSSVNFVGLE